MKHVIATLNELELNVGEKKRERKKYIINIIPAGNT